MTNQQSSYVILGMSYGLEALCEGAKHMGVQRWSKRVRNESERGAGEKVM